jgi:hypothetical protein
MVLIFEEEKEFPNSDSAKLLKVFNQSMLTSFFLVFNYTI